MKEKKELKKSEGSGKEKNLTKTIKEIGKSVAKESAWIAMWMYLDLPLEYEIPIKFLLAQIIEAITSLK